MMRLHLKKQICMEGGCMLGDWIYYMVWGLVVWYGVVLGRELLVLFMTWIKYKREEWL